MNSQFANNTSISSLRKQISPRFIACGIWLRVAFIGACAFAVGLIQLFDGEVKPLYALGLAVVGGLLAAFSWRRAQNALEAADDAGSAVEASASLPAKALAS